MRKLSPEATYDCLFIAGCLQSSVGSSAFPEIHLFAYLGCLLWLYRNRTVADWGYAFVGTELGAPFSQEIDGAMKKLLEHGFFLRIENRLRITDLGEQYVSDFGQLNINQDRTECLRAACACSAMFSVGMVCNAMTQEPELNRAQSMPTDRFLLGESAIYKLYLQFDKLRSVFNEPNNDLRVPAVIWIEALYRMNQTAMEQLQ